jgi:hypothetical protein
MLVAAGCMVEARGYLTHWHLAKDGSQHSDALGYKIRTLKN